MSHCGCVCISLMTRDTGHFSCIFLAIVSLLSRNVYSGPLFLNWVVCFSLLLSLFSPCYILDTSPLSDAECANVFSCAVGSLCTLSIDCSHCAEVKLDLTRVLRLQGEQKQ